MVRVGSSCKPQEGDTGGTNGDKYIARACFGLAGATMDNLNLVRLTLRQRAGPDHWPEAFHLMKTMVQAQVV